jgi:site-specific recombinase XerC
MTKTEFSVHVLWYGPWRLMVSEDGACWLEPPREQRIGAATLPTHEDLIEAIQAWEHSKAAADLRSLDTKYEIAVIRFKMGCKSMSQKAVTQRKARVGGFWKWLIDKIRSKANEKRTIKMVKDIMSKEHVR